MDDDLKDFECELRRLQPVAPSPALEARIAREIGSAGAPPALQSPRRPLPWLWSMALPAAAAIVIIIAAQKSGRGILPVKTDDHGRDVRATTAGAAEELKPVTAENVLYAARDEGVVVLEDGTPARRERLQFVDTITWKNPRTNASLRWTVPREEVRVVPISFQ